MSDPSHSPNIPQAAIDALRRGNKIEAIKILREEQHLGLKEAKGQVEAYVRSQPELQRKLDAMQAEAKQGCVRWVIIVLVLLACGYYFFVSR